MGGRDRVGNGADEIAIRLTGFGQMIDGLTLVEASHFNRIFDRHTVSVDTQRAIGGLRDRNNATIDLRRELAIDFHLLLAGGFPFCQRRVVEVWKSDGALDLQGAITFEENRSRVGIDPMNRGVRCRVRQKCEHASLA